MVSVSVFACPDWSLDTRRSLDVRAVSFASEDARHYYGTSSYSPQSCVPPAADLRTS